MSLSPEPAIRAMDRSEQRPLLIGGLQLLQLLDDGLVGLLPLAPQLLEALVLLQVLQEVFVGNCWSRSRGLFNRCGIGCVCVKMEIRNPHETRVRGAGELV